MATEGRLELPAFAFVARCDNPISLLRHWGVLRELNSELQIHILPCCRYTKDAIETMESEGGIEPPFAVLQTAANSSIDNSPMVPVLRVSTPLPPSVCNSLVIGQTYGL